MNQLANTDNARQIAPQSSGAVEAEMQRAIAEVQVAMTVARRFPRDIVQVRDRIQQACSRVALAEKSTYSYTRGGTLVTGGSIDYAECIAQNWGNLNYGHKELTQRDGVSEVEAFAWDLETGTRRSITFHVPHIRYAKSGITKLTDPRDIYETVANQAARRVRKCIEDVVHKDVWEDGLAQCEVTLANASGAPEEQIKKLVEAFAAWKVTPEMLMRKLGHKLDAVNQAEVIRLKATYRAIKDGMTTVDAEFGAAESTAEEATPKNAKDAARVKASKLQERATPAAKKSPLTFAEFSDSIEHCAGVAAAAELLEQAALLVTPSEHSALAAMAADLFPHDEAES